jgi:hypothetical protein
MISELYEKFEDTKWITRSPNRRGKGNAVDKRKRTEVQIMIYTTIYRKLNIEQLEPKKAPGVNSGTPEGYAVSLLGLVAIIL